MPLNNTITRGRDEICKNIVTQLVKNPITRKFQVQTEESTVRDGESLLLTYVRYID